MKKCFVTMLAILSLFIMVGCGGDSPKKVAQKFHKALMNKDLNAVKDLCTERTQSLIMMSFSLMADDEVLEKAKKTKYTYEEIIDGDTAIVTYSVDGSKKGEVINLVKQDGKWLVDIEGK